MKINPHTTCALLLLVVSSVAASAQTTLPASLKAAPGSWNPSVQGFAVRPHQITVPRGPGDANSIANVEKELNGGFGASIATPGPNAGYYFTNVLDFSDPESQDAGQLFFNNFPFPGIDLDLASPTYNPSNFVMEAITYLNLPVGQVSLSVRSDDSFRLTIGLSDNPLDYTALAPAGAVFDGSRGPANNTFTLNVASAGVYPVRIVYGQGGGGANLEFWATIDSFGTPTPMLINDPIYPDNALKSYVPASLPIAPGSAYARFLNPFPGQTGVSPLPVILAELKDAGTTVNASGITLAVDGSPVATSVVQNGGLTTVTGSVTNLLTANSVHTATLVYQDSTPKSVTNTWSFSVINYFPLPASYSYPVGSGNVAAKGFSGKINVARKSSGGFNASVSVTDLRLKDLVNDPATLQPYSNLVQTVAIPGPSANTVNNDGTYTRNGPINYSLDTLGAAALDNGQFNSAGGQGDTIYPGLPGANEADRLAFENVGILAWAEWTWLELPQGLIRLNMGHFDAGQVAIHANDPRDIFRESVIIFDSNGGNRTDSTLVYVETPGVYGFRCAQACFGTGGSPWFEFYASDPNNVTSPTLIGDSTNTASIKAFTQLTVTTRPYINAVYPGVASSGIPLNTNIQVDVVNLGAETPVMKVNGQTVSYSTSVSGNTTKLTHTPAQPFNKAAAVIVSLTYGTTTSTWNFFTTTGLKALVVGAEKASIGQRLASKHGLDVTQLLEGNVPVDTNFLAQFVMIWNSEAVNSGNAAPYINLMRNNGLAVPVINVEQGNVDEWFPGLGGAQTGGAPVQSIIIKHPESPLAGGLTGTNRLLIASAPGTGPQWHRSASVPAYATPMDSIGTALNDVDGSIWGVTAGTDNGAGYVYPARRVQFAIAGPTMIQYWNDNAWKLFDAAVSWVLPPKLFISTPSAGNVKISWTGEGTLQESATMDPGSWTASAVQTNPQTRPASGTKFFRVIQ